MAIAGSFKVPFRFLRLVVLGSLAVLAAMLVMAFSASDAKAETVLASWYGPGFAGNPTASGEIYDPYGYTAAHKTLPLGTELVVSYGGRSVNVVVNDRGPYIAGRDLDLSQGAAEYLGLTQAGVDYVDYYVVGSGDYSGVTQSSTVNGGTSVSETTSVSDGSYSASQTVVQSSDYSGGSGAYVVQSGETLSGIAASLGVSVDYLAQANGIYDADYIVSGQTLYF